MSITLPYSRRNQLCTDRNNNETDCRIISRYINLFDISSWQSDSLPADDNFGTYTHDKS